MRSNAVKRRLVWVFLAGLLSAPAAAAPFEKGDPAIGKKLVEKSCTRCHDSSMYTRPDRKVTSAEKLAGQISACNNAVNAGWFPEEEAHVGAYLNEEFYKFK
jgi:hypothetical protein